MPPQKKKKPKKKKTYNTWVLVDHDSQEVVDTVKATTYNDAIKQVIKGHDWLSLYTLDNADVMGGVWKSSWGSHKCMRCGKEEGWQYDKPF